jgi:hypothetical protein
VNPCSEKTSNIVKKVFFPAILWLLFFPISSFCIIPVTISDKDIDELHFWKGQNIELLEDPENSYKLEDILSKKYDNKFYTDKSDVPLTLKNNVTYWGRIKIKKNTKDNYAWVFEAYDQSTDEFDIYIPDASGKYTLYKSGDNRLFSGRQYKHKNFVFDLNLVNGVEQTIYIKIKAAHTVSFIGVIRNVHSFIGYALKEYFYLSLFYGLVLSLIIFNLMQYFVTRSRIYLVYVLYMCTAALYSSSQDGFGYQFLWTDIYQLNNVVQFMASFLVPVLLLILSYQFLKETNPEKKYIQFGLALIGIRFIHLIFSVAGYIPFPHFYIDTFIRLFILILSIRALYKGHRQLRYYTIAMLMLFIGYTIRELTINGLFPNTIATVYMHLLGESLQMLFISLALGERIKIKMENMVISQEAALSELAQTQFKTEQVRKELQQTVEEQIAREKYVSGGISELSSIIANHLNDTKQLYKKLTKFIADYFECRLVALYLLPPGNNVLELSAGYGLDEARLDNITIQEGEGLLGQCMIEKERIEIRNVPEEYVSIASGLGQTTPKLIIIEPLHFNQQFVGIIEMASLKEFSPLQYEVLDKFTAQISSTLSNVLFNETTRNMLEESIRKEEILRQQEEEMRQQVEELMATQEGYNKKEEQYLAEIEALKKK